MFDADDAYFKSRAKELLTTEHRSENHTEAATDKRVKLTVKQTPISMIQNTLFNFSKT